jgi:hypothetical protein
VSKRDWQFNKTEFKEEMIKAGLWQKFIARREALKAEGKNAQDAWAIAMKEFASRTQQEPALAEPAPAPPFVEQVDPVPADEMVPVDADGPAEPPITEKLNPADVAWALAHLDSPRPPTPPSKAAMAWWSWANSGTLARQAFMTQVVTKLFPSKKEIDEAASRKGDDGRDLAKWYEELADLRDGILHSH